MDLDEDLDEAHQAGPEEFDAFNDDTFGAAADAWDEDGHEELAKMTEEELHGVHAANDFFELDGLGGGGDLGDCLEPPGEETLNGDQGLHDEMGAMRLTPPSSAPISNAKPAEFVDPAIMSMGSMPLPPQQAPPMNILPPPQQRGSMFPPPPQAQGLPMRPPMPPMAAPMTVEELERQMIAQQEQQQMMRRLQEQQQQQQLLMHQREMMIRAQMQRQQQEQMARQQAYHQHQQQQHQQQANHHGFQSRQQQLLQQQFHRHQQRQQNEGYQRQQNDGYQRQQNDGYQRRQNEGYDDYGRNRRSRDQQQKIYDDKDRETFGDDFVTDHKQQQHHENPLIMPGHVQVQKILRGARSQGQAGHRPSSQLDHHQQHQQPYHHFHHHQRGDEYAGLMSQRERGWVINIQLNQLKDENDYYYTVYHQKKKAEAEGVDLKKGRRFFFGEEEEAVDEDDEDKRMFKRDEETLLLLKSDSMSMDSPRDEYTPLQYENSLGKLQAVTVKAPRKIIDVMGVLNQDAEQLSSTQKDSRNFKKTLMELERFYNILIDVEDCEKKLAVLPTGTSLRTQVETDGKEGISNLGLQLVREDKLKLYMTVRKGKVLLIRALRWLNTPQMRIVVSTLLQNYPLAVKKDRDDKLLKEFWHAGIRRHVLNCSSMGLLHYYFAFLTSENQHLQTKSGSILRALLTTPLGMSFILALIQRLTFLHQQQPNADVTKSRNLLVNLGKKLAEEHKSEKFSCSIHPQSVELPHSMFNNKDVESESHQQLQKLIHAGLSSD